MPDADGLWATMIFLSSEQFSHGVAYLNCAVHWAGGAVFWAVGLVVVHEGLRNWDNN